MFQPGSGAPCLHSELTNPVGCVTQGDSLSSELQVPASLLTRLRGVHSSSQSLGDAMGALQQILGPA